MFKKPSILLLVTVLLFAGCKKRQSIEDILTDGHSTYWNILSRDNTFISGSYLFDKSGSCVYYHYKAGKRSELYDDDVVYPHTWKLAGDTVLTIQGFDWRLLKWANDSIYLKNVNKGDTLILVKSK